MTDNTAQQPSRARLPIGEYASSWYDDAPITDEQYASVWDSAMAVQERPSYSRHVVRKLLAELERLRAGQPELSNEWGIGTDYTNTTRSEQAVSNNLAEALHLLDIARIHRRPDVVSEELIVREVGEWRKPEEGDDRG